MSDLFQLEMLHRLKCVANDRIHWRQKANETKTLRRAVRWACYYAWSGEFAESDTARIVGEGRFHLHFHRVGKRLLDDDNLANAFKAVRDEVCSFLHIGDSPKDPVFFTYSQSSGSVYKISVEVKAVQNDG